MRAPSAQVVRQTQRGLRSGSGMGVTARQQQHKTHGRQQPEHAEGAHGDTPTKLVGQCAHANAPGHTAKRRTADIQAHRKTESARMDFVGQIGHGHSGHTAQ